MIKFENKTLWVKYFFMMELVVALGLLALLSAGFFAGMKTLKEMDRSFTDERRALMVVDNTLERLENKKQYGVADVEKIFMDEYGKGGFAKNSKVKSSIKKEADKVIIAVLKPNGKPFIKAGIKCQNRK